MLGAFLAVFDTYVHERILNMADRRFSDSYSHHNDHYNENAHPGDDGHAASPNLLNDATYGNVEGYGGPHPYTGRGTEGILGGPGPDIRTIVRSDIWYNGAENAKEDTDEKIQEFVRNYPRQGQRVNNEFLSIGRAFQGIRDQLDASPQGQAYQAYQEAVRYNPNAPKSPDVESYEAQKFELDVEQTARRLEKLQELKISAESYAQTQDAASSSSRSGGRHRHRR
jgi:hypothetical protein